MITYDEAFHLASLQFITFDHFESIHHQCLKFLIFQFDEQAFGFLGIIHFHISRFPFFPSRILVCATAFAAHYLFSF